MEAHIDRVRGNKMNMTASTRQKRARKANRNKARPSQVLEPNHFFQPEPTKLAYEESEQKEHQKEALTQPQQPFLGDPEYTLLMVLYLHRIAKPQTSFFLFKLILSYSFFLVIYSNWMSTKHFS